MTIEARDLRQLTDALSGDGGTAAADELFRRGFNHHPSTNPRGTLIEAAVSPLTRKELDDFFIPSLKSPDPIVSARAAFVLGMWGGEEEAEKISELLRGETNDVLRNNYIGALRMIGGPDATRALISEARKHSNTESIRSSALASIGELISGGSITDDGEIDPEGGIRPPFDEEALKLIEEVRETLGQIHEEKEASEFLRAVAGELERAVPRR